MFLLLFQLLHYLLHVLQPLLVPVCFVVAWLVVILTVWNIWSAIATAVAQAKQMHRIPCADCKFFTDDHRLKCPVHPIQAMSEQAIDCPDYEVLNPFYRIEPKQPG